MQKIESKTIWDLSMVPDREKTRLELTDLCRYKGYWYCGYCEGEIHNSHPSGRARILRSVDGEKWETAVLLDWDAGDVRDPMFSITAEGSLMITSSIAFVSKEPRIDTESTNQDLNDVFLPSEALRQKNATDRFYQLDTRFIPETDSEAGGVARQSVTWLSSDGINWGSVFADESGVNTWRWYTTWHNGMGYNLGYGGKDKNGTLYRTRDGKSWRALKENFFPTGSGNEGCVVFGDDDTAYCLLRDGLLRDDSPSTIEKPAVHGTALPMLGIGKAPYYTEWEWREIEFDWQNDGVITSANETLSAPIGGPKVIKTENGLFIAVARALGPGMDDGRICLFTLDPEKSLMTRFAELDGTTYAGIHEHEGMLWVASCSYPDVTEVLLAKVEIP